MAELRVLLKEQQHHPMEAQNSWERHLAVIAGDEPSKHRLLLKHHQNPDASDIEEQREAAFWQHERLHQQDVDKLRRHQRKKHSKRIEQMLSSSAGIHSATTHGIMIDAGSTGSRLHVYEWEPRVLQNSDEIQAAVSGNKLSFPGTESRWTDRLRPGLAEFADIADDEQLFAAVSDYLQPLLDFATTVLHEKRDTLDQYPIFLRATAGMRMLDANDRARVLQSVRRFFHASPFAFVDEQARVLSGEEEAIFDWAAVNFLLGDLVQQSEGAGTVVNPRTTHGALDLGGASTQISFYETSEDIMSSLFKFQLGQAKHWNIYAHSFLFYGMNEAIDRFHASLIADKTVDERMVTGVYNPCLPVNGTPFDVRTNIHFTKNGVETWDYQKGLYPSGDGFFQATLVNDKSEPNVDLCLEYAARLLHNEKNDWCNFAHNGDCSFAGIYQPALPRQQQQDDSSNFGEFVAFSNYYHIWQFLHLPERATIAQLENATRYACSLSHDELVTFNNGVIEEMDELDRYCFRSAYALQLLHKGYGFQMNDTIRATEVIHGQKVGWALGAMLYEINAMPWTYSSSSSEQQQHFVIATDETHIHMAWETAGLVLIVFGTVLSLLCVFCVRERSLRKLYRDQYEPIKEVMELSV